MLLVLIRIAILISTHNVCFCGEIWKTFLNYHQRPTMSVSLPEQVA